MVTQEIKAEEYEVIYESDTTTVTLSGSLRLSGLEDTNPVIKLLHGILEENPSLITINLQELEFLNSSGINMLSKFVIKVRQKKETSLTVLASTKIAWQGKSLKNLQKLMPSLELKIE
jgi:hypothetical protein